MSFALHSQLAADTIPLCDLPFCRALLMNNAKFPWIILVPLQADAREITDISAEQRAVLMEEIAHASTVLQAFTGAEKMNIAALGNMVPQLHVHIVARFTNDPAWPNPVWNSGVLAEPYAPGVAASLTQELAARLARQPGA